MHIVLGLGIGALSGLATLWVAAWRARRHVEGSRLAWLGYPATLGLVALGFAGALSITEEAAWAFAVGLVTARLAGVAGVRRTV